MCEPIWPVPWKGVSGFVGDIAEEEIYANESNFANVWSRHGCGTTSSEVRCGGRLLQVVVKVKI
jgi:hypothetical protein